MKEHPILFSAPMVRAILDGRKTQTRRVVKATHHYGGGFPSGHTRAIVGFHSPAPEEHLPAVFGASFRNDLGADWLIACHYGAPGDRLWVRETHAIVPSSAYRLSRDDDGNLIPHRVSDDGYYWCVYREGWSRSRPSRWSPSIHMPRWASRLTLEVVSVRVERVQEIREEDARHEGLRGPLIDPELDLIVNQIGLTPRGAFAALWDSINGKKPGCSWADNPWCWVIEFKRVGA